MAAIEPRIVDARGLRCPLPVLRLAKAAAGAAPGTRFELIADDPAARADVPAFVRERNWTGVEMVAGPGNATRYLLVR